MSSPAAFSPSARCAPRTRRRRGLLPRRSSPQRRGCGVPAPDQQPQVLADAEHRFARPQQANPTDPDARGARPKSITRLSSPRRSGLMTTFLLVAACSSGGKPPLKAPSRRRRSRAPMLGPARTTGERRRAGSLAAAMEPVAHRSVNLANVITAPSAARKREMTTSGMSARPGTGALALALISPEPCGPGLSGLAGPTTHEAATESTTASTRARRRWLTWFSALPLAVAPGRSGGRL